MFSERRGGSVCKSQADGGKRCAAHTRPRFEAATFGTSEWDEAAAEFARTKAGREVVTQVALAALRERDIDRACAAQAALDVAERRDAADREIGNTRHQLLHGLAYTTRSVDVLRRHATSEDAAVRQAVASNANTPDDVLVALATDRRKDVRWTVAQRWNKSAAVATALLSDDDFHIRLAAYQSNAALPEGVLVAEWNREDCDRSRKIALIKPAAQRGDEAVLRKALAERVDDLELARRPDLPHDMALALVQSDRMFASGAALLQSSISAEEARNLLEQHPGIVANAHPHEHASLISKIGAAAAVDKERVLVARAQ